MKIWKCMGCGNIVYVLKEGTCIPNCCGKEMVELKANTMDGAVEKHVPVVEVKDKEVIVTCGEVLHPMEEKHYIEFMLLETNKGVKVEYLKPGDEPVTHFALLDGEEVVAAYAYCNLHGLWKSK